MCIYKYIHIMVYNVYIYNVYIQNVYIYIMCIYTYIDIHLLAYVGQGEQDPATPPPQLLALDEKHGESALTCMCKLLMRID